jgi:homeobox protein cut-like
MDAMIQERVTAKENELNATYDERMMNYEERSDHNVLSVTSLKLAHRERDLQRQLAVHKSQLRDLQSSTESTHARLFDHSERQGTIQGYVFTLCLICSVPDQEVVAKLAEMDLIVADLERANGRVAAVERRNVS